MPPPGFSWYHLVFTTRGNWLPGDVRGFRSREHRVHSSGDYKRPPVGEHAGLHQHATQLTQNIVKLDADARASVGEAFVLIALKRELELLAIAVGATHAHLLMALPTGYEEAKAVSGRMKQSASLRVKDLVKGRLWAQGGKYQRVKDRAHQRNVFDYILRHRDEGAWVWSFRDEEKTTED